MTSSVVILVTGFSIAGILTLISLGLVLIMRATGTFNFAQGQFMLLPAILAATLQSQGWPFWLCIVLGIAAGATIAALFYRFVLQRTTGLNQIFPIIATLGLAEVIDGAMGLAFGTPSHSFRVPFLPSGTVEIGGASFNTDSLIVATASLLFGLVATAVLRYTRVGARMRAAGQDPLLASMGALNVRRLFTAAWVAAAVLAAVAGFAYASTTVINPTVVGVALLAAPAIVLGGLDSIEGAIVGSLIIGFVQAATTTLLGGEYAEVVSYVILLLVLQFKPQGLFGTKQIVRA